MQEKYITAYQAAIANGATANIPLITQDENVDRIVTGLYVTPTAVDVSVNLVLRSQPLINLAGSMFDKTHGPVKLNVTYPQGQQIQVQIINNSGGATPNLDVVIRYEING